MMTYIVYKLPPKRFDSFVSIRRSGYIYFSKGLIEKYKFADYKYLSFYYDKKELKIAVQLLDRLKDGESIKFNKKHEYKISGLFNQLGINAKDYKGLYYPQNPETLGSAFAFEICLKKEL